MLLVFMMCASSVCLLCIPFIVICRILRSCMLCCVNCWWLVADVVWGGLDVNELVAGAICGVLDVHGLVVGAIWGVVVADAQVSDADWRVLCMGRLVADALVGDVVWVFWASMSW